MFKFDFNIADANTASVEAPFEENDTRKEDGSDQRKLPPLMVSTVDDLIKTLPSLISYSPLHVPLPGNPSFTLPRRDLFDARFQLISESSITEPSDGLDFIDARSDLVPGVYEGGLKTWECSVDLASYLDGVDMGTVHAILEVGCGTAIPSLYVLRKLFHTDRASRSTETTWTTLHMQDFNSVVFQLVTLPNIILIWYESPASDPYRATQEQPLPKASFLQPGELSLTPELLSAFLESLKECHINLTFVSGSWADTEAWICDQRFAYDLILTSETIYSPSSLPSLISLLKTASVLRKTRQENESSSRQLERFPLAPLSRTTPTLCLVAAKVIYFGVGGGINDFEKAANNAGGLTQTVMERKSGVSRQIVQVTWPQEKSD